MLSYLRDISKAIRNNEIGIKESTIILKEYDYNFDKFVKEIMELEIGVGLKAPQLAFEGK